MFDVVKEKWLKFNDITVTEATWEELEKESVGGYHNASAYCLMYTKRACFTPDTGKYIDFLGGEVVEHPLFGVGGRRFDPYLGHTKDLTKW